MCEPSARRFRSPLRPDPRPLRGILLAWHAIAYMAAFYREADLAGLPLDGDAQARWRRLLDQADDCAATLQTAEDDLTEAGLAFCAETQGVVNYARL